MSKRYGRVIWWIKRDIRINDNEALAWAVEHGANVLPLYVVEPLIVQHPDWSGFHAQAVEEALRSLIHRLDRIGARIAVAQGEILSVLEHARSTLGVDAVVAHVSGDMRN